MMRTTSSVRLKDCFEEFERDLGWGRRSDIDVVDELGWHVGIYRHGRGHERSKELEREEKIEETGPWWGWVKERRVGEYEERMRRDGIEGGGRRGGGER